VPGLQGGAEKPGGWRPRRIRASQKGVTVIAIKNGAFTLGAEVVPEKVPAP